MFLNKDYLELDSDQIPQNLDKPSTQIKDPGSIENTSLESQNKRPQRSQNNRFQLKKQDDIKPSPQRNLVKKTTESDYQQQVQQNPSFLDEENYIENQVKSREEKVKRGNDSGRHLFMVEDEDELESKSEDVSPIMQQQQNSSSSSTYHQRQKVLEQQKLYMQEKQKQQYSSQGIQQNYGYQKGMNNDDDLDFKRLALIMQQNSNQQHEPGQFNYNIESLPQLKSFDNKIGFDDSKLTIARQPDENTTIDQKRPHTIFNLQVQELQSESNSEEQEIEEIEKEGENLLMEQGKEEELRKELKQQNEKILIEEQLALQQEEADPPDSSPEIDKPVIVVAQTVQPVKKIAYPKPIVGLVITDMRNFLTTSPQRDGMIQCTIKRDKSGMGRFYPKYHIHLSDGFKYLMTAKKQAYNNTSNYIISFNKNDLNKKSMYFLGKVRSNFMGTEFNLFNNGENVKKAKTLEKARSQLGMVFYESNILGTKGPRKMKVLMPKIDEATNQPIEYKPSLISQQNSLQEDYQLKNTDKMVVCINRPPRWNNQVNAFVLNFYGRVDKPSVKNFQLVEEGGDDLILLQFGRVGEDLFNLDFQYPMSPLLAFQIALSSFDYKIACE